MLYIEWIERFFKRRDVWGRFSHVSSSLHSVFIIISIIFSHRFYYFILRCSHLEFINILNIFIEKIINVKVRNVTSIRKKKKKIVCFFLKSFQFYSVYVSSAWQQKLVGDEVLILFFLSTHKNSSILIHLFNFIYANVWLIWISLRLES